MAGPLVGSRSLFVRGALEPKWLWMSVSVSVSVSLSVSVSVFVSLSVCASVYVSVSVSVFASASVYVSVSASSGSGMTSVAEARLTRIGPGAPVTMAVDGCWSGPGLALGLGP